jgi:hypothetical protein
LPTSEKMFVGNIPTGTRFYGEKLAVGFIGKMHGGPDLDLSGLNIAGKIGWNAAYNQADGQLMYSGDMTSAPNGAVEYLYANKGLNTNSGHEQCFHGDANCGYKIVVGKGDHISYYMMNPNLLLLKPNVVLYRSRLFLECCCPKVKNNVSYC